MTLQGPRLGCNGCVAHARLAGPADVAASHPVLVAIGFGIIGALLAKHVPAVGGDWGADRADHLRQRSLHGARRRRGKKKR